jgi:adenylate kinase
LEGVVGITGSPGTGKKSVAPLVAAKLGLGCYGLNDLARSFGLLESPDGSVDTDALKRKLRTFERHVVFYGHLLPYVVERDAVSKVAVLRCEPYALKLRLKKRGYPKEKVVENVEAELIGLESYDAFEAFGPERTFEVDTTRSTATESAEKILSTLNGRRLPGSPLDWQSAYDTGAKLRSLLSTDDS